MLADFLPSSCFLHSGEIIRNDFILTAQMHTKWNWELLLLQWRAGYGAANRPQINGRGLCHGKL